MTPPRPVEFADIVLLCLHTMFDCASTETQEHMELDISREPRKFCRRKTNSRARSLSLNQDVVSDEGTRLRNSWVAGCNWGFVPLVITLSICSSSIQ